MKVLHVETGRNLYGGSLQVRYLLEGLAESGVENILVCEQSSALAEAVSNWTSKTYREAIRGDLDIKFIGRLKEIIQQTKPDLVHLHSRRGCDVLGGIAARLAGVPVVLSRRVDNPESRWIAKLKYRLYDHIVTISEGIRCVLASEGVPLQKISCVPSAVDLSQYQQPSDRIWFKEQFAVDESDYVVGVVAQLIPRKGHRHLIQVLPELCKQNPQLKVLMFGKGALQEKLQQQIDEAGLNQHVFLVGFRDDLAKVLPNLDLLVHPAEMEGLGVSLLQASAAGVPIIATTAGGMPEIIRHGMTGLLVPPAEPQALQQAIETIISQPERARQMADSARQLVAVAFSIPAMVQGNLAVYQQVLTDKKG